VTLEVHDDGIGISKEDLPRVFERFFRADPARRRDAGGTGLGLSIAQWIADQHGADISLSSELGHGTRVLDKMPLAR
jgi:signal transduction histidine kinase